MLLPLVASGGLLGAAIGQAAGFAGGLLVANSIGGAIFWAQFSKAVAEEGLVQGPSPAVPL